MSNSYDFVRLGEYSALLWAYSWLDVETYMIVGFDPEGYNQESLFSTLLQHKLYQRSFITPKALEKPADIHGPFEIAKLSPNNFKAITSEQFLKRIDEIFYSEYGFAPDDDQIDRARQSEARGLLDRLPKNSADYYELDVSREDERYHHELWWILTFFYEFIIIERSTQKLYLCFIGAD